MSKYNIDKGASRQEVLLGFIANEMAEANRLKRLELEWYLKVVADADVRRMIHYDPDRKQIISNLGRNQFDAISKIGSMFSRDYSQEEIAAAAQNHFERIVVRIVKDYLRSTGKRKLLLAGGLFGNVKLNQRLNPAVSGIVEVSVRRDLDGNTRVGGRAVRFSADLRLGWTKIP